MDIKKHKYNFKDWLVIIFNCLFFVTFTIVFANVLLNLTNNTSFYPFNPVYILIGSVIFITFLFFFYKFIKKYLKNIKHRYILIPLFICMFILQVLLAFRLAFELGNDFGLLFINATNQAFGLDFNQTVLDYSYFEIYPHNIPMFLIDYFIILFVKNLFPYYDIAQCQIISLILAYIINAAVICLSMFIVYLIIKKTINKNYALIAVFIGFIMVPFYVYTSSFYTDTLSMIFPVLAIYIYLIYKDTKSKSKLILLLLGGTISLACEFKMTVIIILIAIIIEMFLKFRVKKLISSVLFIILGFFIVSCLFNVIIIKSENKFDFDRTENDKKFPYSHWVAMGLSGNGDWGREDFEDSLNAQDYEDRNTINVNKIKTRITDFGFKGLAKHLLNKSYFTWADGNYYSQSWMGSMAKYHEGINKYFYYSNNNEKYKYIGYFTQIIHFSIFSLIIFLAFTNIRRGRKSKGNIILLSIYGIFIFLLVWETRSRYLVNFIPIFIYGSVMGLRQLELVVKKYKVKKVRKLKEKGNG